MANISYTRTQRLVGTSVLIALIVVLQVLATVTGQLLPATISLSLVPIIVGAVLFGPEVGAVLGFAFSMVVFISSISGLDKSGFAMFSINPIATCLIIFIKGTLSGFLSGIISNIFSKNNLWLGVICAAIITPVTNTLLFCAGASIFFKELILSWAEGSGIEEQYVFFVCFALVATNFIVELIIDIVLSPVIVRIISVLKKNR